MNKDREALKQLHNITNEILNNNTMKDAKQFFKSMDKNFMTPEVISYHTTSKYFIEYSTGRGIDNDAIYGLTIYDIESEGLLDISSYYSSKEEAQTELERLIKEDN